MDNIIEFFLPMLPPTATHQQKKIDTRGRKPRVYASSAAKNARAKLTAHLAKYAPIAPMSGALQLTACWYFPLSKTHPDGSYKTTRPDCDNLNKLLADVMSDLGYWHDDAQIAVLNVAKYYAERCGIYIKIEKLEEK